MPLLKCNPGYNYQAILFTGGPWSDGMDPTSICRCLNGIVQTTYSDNVSKVESVFETSSDGYKHFHIALLLKRPAKIAKASKQLLKEVRNWPRDSEETRQPNVGAYYVPAGGTKPRWQILDDYLRNPSKEKETGLVIETVMSEKGRFCQSVGIRPEELKDYLSELRMMPISDRCAMHALDKRVAKEARLAGFQYVDQYLAARSGHPPNSTPTNHA
jgi:hypothetical protein